MMNEAALKKIEVLMNTTEFQQKLSEVSTPEGVYNFFTQHGITLSLSEINDMLLEETDVLSVDDLDEVVGGCHGIRHIIGYRIVWGPIGISRRNFNIIYGPRLVPKYCNK